MNVTRNVIHDLMPLYLGGEASADTRQLVEEYLRAHPEDAPQDLPGTLPGVTPPPGIEMASLDRTRKLYAYRAQSLAAAFALSYGIFSFRFNNEGLQFVLYRDLPVVAWVMLGLAAAAWVVHLVLQRRWMATGLAPTGHFSNGVWMLGGALAGVPYAFLLSHQFGWDAVRDLTVVGAFAGLAIGRALHPKP